MGQGEQSICIPFTGIEQREESWERYQSAEGVKLFPLKLSVDLAHLSVKFPTCSSESSARRSLASVTWIIVGCFSLDPTLNLHFTETDWQAFLSWKFILIVSETVTPSEFIRPRSACRHDYKQFCFTQTHNCLVSFNCFCCVHVNFLRPKNISWGVSCSPSRFCAGHSCLMPIVHTCMVPNETGNCIPGRASFSSSLNCLTVPDESVNSRRSAPESARMILCACRIEH